MARFTIQALAATFIDCGTHQMVSTAFGAPVLHHETVDVANLPALKAHFERAREALDAAGKPYSLSARLDHGQSAPNGWKNNAFQFRHDNDCGSASK